MAPTLQILNKIKRHDRKGSKPCDGPPVMDFQVQETAKGTAAKSQEKISRVLREPIPRIRMILAPRL